MRPAVGIISKVPRAGHSKTRLARTLGPKAALDLHRAFLEDELAALHAPEHWALFLVHDAVEPSEDAQLARLVADRATGLVPGAPDLPRELLAAFRALLAHHDRAVIVSGDVPQIAKQHVEAALDALYEHDLVLGPGRDGGYYLVGLRRPLDVFTPVAMGGQGVFNATVALARSLGLSVATVPALADVDEAQDLPGLVGAPATQAVLAGLERGPVAVQLPTELQVEVTNRCNLPCSACLRTAHPLEAPGDLSFDQFRAIVDPLPDLQRVAFHLNGEPLMNRQLGAMIRHCAERGVDTVLNTNALLLDDAQAAMLVDSGLHDLRISINGARPETVAAAAGADVRDRVLAAAERVVRLRTTTPRVGLWTMATRQAVLELPLLVELAAGVGADEVYVQRLVLTGHGQATSEHSVHGSPEPDHLAAIARAEQRALQLGVALRASGRQGVVESLTADPSPNPRLGCWRPWRTAAVTAHGTVLPCCIASFRATYAEQALGRLGEEGWAELWNGGAYRRIRQGILSGRPEPWCAGCGVEWSL